MVSLAKTSSFCWTSPWTFSSPAEPRMSASPAERTLLAIILAASAMSYRMPDSWPVACGCRRSCSMMNRSMVTTEVALFCSTTCTRHELGQFKTAPRTLISEALKSAHRPSLAHRFQLQRAAIGARDHRSVAVGAQHEHSPRGQASQDLARRVPIQVASAHRDEGDARPHRVEECVGAARVAAMVGHLQDVRPQLSAAVREEPFLLLTLRVAGHEHRHRTDPDARDGARVVRIGEGVGPRWRGREE